MFCTTIKDFDAVDPKFILKYFLSQFVCIGFILATVFAALAAQCTHIYLTLCVER